MDHVERFVSEITEILNHPADRDELLLAVTRKVSALIGRLGVTDSGFAPAEEVANGVREARARVGQRVTGDAAPKHLVLLELDKALAVVGRNPMPPPALM